MSSIDFTKLRLLAENMIKAGQEMQAALAEIDERHLAIVVTSNVGAAGTLPEKIMVIQHVVCLKYQLTKSDLLKKCRKRELVWPRQVGYWAARQLTSGGSSDIAQLFGGRDHGTVLAGCKRVTDLREVNLKIKAETDAVLAECSKSLKR